MWNYRIIKKENEYGLYEVFYNDDGEISAHAEKAELVDGSPEELLLTLRLMLDDAQKSYYNILEHDEIKFAPFFDENEKLKSIDIKDFINNINNSNN